MDDITHEDHDRRIATVYPSILLSSGRMFDFNNPTPITVGEAAHSLSKLCRFTGHCSEFYSVAQHSILVSRILMNHPQLMLQGLMHDAVEAVLGDMSGPLKKLFPEYKALERKIEKVILQGFGLPDDLHPYVKRADLIALKVEKEAFMRDGPGVGSWDCLEGIGIGFSDRSHLDLVRSLNPGEAAKVFIHLYEAYKVR